MEKELDSKKPLELEKLVKELICIRDKYKELLCRRYHDILYGKVSAYNDIIGLLKWKMMLNE